MAGKFFRLKLLIICSVILVAQSTKNRDLIDNSKIVGGINAPIAKFPYQISLQIQLLPFRSILSAIFISILDQFNYRRLWEFNFHLLKETNTHNCGGSIITNRHVVTAAHCLVNYFPQELSILAGTNKLNSGGIRYQVDTFITHPNYEELVTSDIGMIKIQNTFEFSSTINLIAYSSTFIGSGVSSILSGWGFTNSDRTNFPNDLQYIEFTTISNDECRESEIPVDNTGICTNGVTGRGVCGGDSGGPLVSNNELIGVVSYGTVICAAGYPDVYTRVSEFQPWIADNSKIT